MTQTNSRPPAHGSTGTPATCPDTPEERFARHLRSGLRGLEWYWRLGRLGMECCPRGPDRTRRLAALAADSPPCSLSLLHRVIKFARQYRRAEVVALERDGLRWNQLAILLPIPRAERRGAVAEVIRLRLTCREVRLWKQQRYGDQAPRGGRAPSPLPGHGPGTQARVLANDCRRMCVRHLHSTEVFLRFLQAIDGGAVPTPEELVQLRRAAEAVRLLTAQFGDFRALLEWITTLCEEPAAPEVVGAQCPTDSSARRQVPGEPSCTLEARRPALGAGPNIGPQPPSGSSRSVGLGTPAGEELVSVTVLLSGY